MILYCYDESGVYTGPVSPALSPARPFVNGQPNYICPARCTDKTPPVCPEGTAPVFDGLDWSISENHRGKTAFDTLSGQAVTVAQLGPLAPGLTLSRRPSPNHVWDGQAWREDAQKLLSAMRAARDARLAASDWTQLPDSPLAAGTKEAWRVYRQALRDFPDGWTKDKPWPAKPQE